MKISYRFLVIIFSIGLFVPLSALRAETTNFVCRRISDDKLVGFVVGSDFETAYFRNNSEAFSMDSYGLNSTKVDQIRGSLVNGGSCNIPGVVAGWEKVPIYPSCLCNFDRSKCKTIKQYIDGNFIWPKDTVEEGFKIVDSLSCEDISAKGCCCVYDGPTEESKQCKEVVGESIGKKPVCDVSVFGIEHFAKTTLTSLSESGICGDQAVVAVDKTNTKDLLASEAASALNPMKYKTGVAGINDFIGRAISFLTMAIGSLLLLFYVYAGILWMTAMGNSERTGKAKQIVVWSTLGVIVVLASYAIIKFVFSVVG